MSHCSARPSTREVTSLKSRKHARIKRVLYAPLGFSGVVRTSYQQASSTNAAGGFPALRSRTRPHAFTHDGPRPSWVRRTSPMYRRSRVAQYLQQTLGAADMLDGFEAHDRIIGGAIFRQVHRLGRGAYSPVVWFGWPWLLVLVASFVAATVLRKRPMAEVAIGLSAAGLLYLLPYFFCAPSSDFRYLYWSIVAANINTAIVGGILMQVEFLKSRESQTRK